tara:strand:+ start:29 stop:190 length:162 start_codon:yes stop_codon:yes gene_type:complete
MPKKAAAERQKEYEQRLRDDGYRRLQLWVRREDAEQIVAFAAALREAEVLTDG